MISIIEKHRQTSLNKLKNLKDKQQQKLQENLNKLIKINDINTTTINNCNEIEIQQKISSKLKLQKLQEIVTKYAEETGSNMTIDEEKKNEDEIATFNYKLITKFDKAKFMTNIHSSLTIAISSKEHIKLKHDNIQFDHDQLKS